MKKPFFFFAVMLALLLGLNIALAEHTTWKQYFPDYKLSQLEIYKGSKPTVSDEQFWDMARERNVYGWRENRLISVFQLLELAHDGNTNHRNYMRDLFLTHLYIAYENDYTIGDRFFHSYTIKGEGMTIQPLTIVFEILDEDYEVLVECERPYKQEVTYVDHLDNSYGIKLFDYNHRMLERALTAIEEGDIRTAIDLAYGVNEYNSGNNPRGTSTPSSRTGSKYGDYRIIATFYQGAMPVYAGPSYKSDRLANGKATLGSDSWCYWYGNSGDWALVEYELSKGGFRVGWVYYPAGRVWQAHTSADYFQEALSRIED